MVELNDLNLDGFVLSIDHNTKKDYAKRTVITLKITNLKSNKITTSLYNSRYISAESGILEIYDTKPTNIQFCDGYEILNNSFVNIDISFDNLKSIGDGDRFELHLKNIADLIVVRNDNKWYVKDYETLMNQQNYLCSVIERFEVIEEKIGINLQNFSIK